MNIRNIVALCALSIFAASPSVAAGPKGHYAIRGIGGVQCGVLAKDLIQSNVVKRKALVVQLDAWVGGYLTYINRSANGAFDAMPLASNKDVVQTIVAACERNRKATFEEETFNTIKKLYPYRVMEFSPVTAETRKVPLREGVVVEIQRKLISHGFLHGNADGKLGKRSLSALYSFERKNNLPSSPILNLEAVLRVLQTK